MSRELWGKPFSAKKLWSTAALGIAQSRGSGTIPGTVLRCAVDAISILFLIVLIILMKDGYVEMQKDCAFIVRPKGCEVGKNYKIILSRQLLLH